jgi:Flp pilus assembly protein TadG
MMMKIQGQKSERGAMTIFVAVILVAILGFAAMAVDLGYGVVVKSELQNVADTGALAGTRALATAYSDGTCDQPYWGDCPQSSVRAKVEAKVNAMATANKAGGKSLSVASSDIIIGKYNKTTGEIEHADEGAMAVKVVARRDETSNGVIQTWLGRAIGTNSYGLNASSGSTLSALKKAPAGKLGIPVGISKSWFTAKNSPCGKHDIAGHGIRIFPTGPQQGETVDTAKSCAGWHTFEDTPATASKLRETLDGLRTGTFVSPVTEAFKTSYVFTGGTIANAFLNMKQLYNTQKASDGTWTTVIPIYESSTCANPSGAIKIVGFATIWIYDVNEGAKTIDATVDCNVVDWGEGGGDDYGTLVGNPGMIQ